MMRKELMQGLDEAEDVLVWLEDKPEDVTMIRLMRTVFSLLYTLLLWAVKTETRRGRTESSAPMEGPVHGL